MTQLLNVGKGIAHKIGPALLGAVANSLEFVVRQRCAHIGRVQWGNILLDRAAVRLLALAARTEQAKPGVGPN
jgi:hypothetical protein